MSPNQIVAVLVRLFAVGLAIYALRIATETVAFSWEVGESNIPLYALAVLGVSIFLAALLWSFPRFFSAKLLGSVNVKKDPETLTTESALSVGFVLMGALLLYWAIADTVYWLAFYRQLDAMDAAFVTEQVGAANMAAIFSTAAEFLMAVVLLLGNKRLSRLAYRLRYGG